MDFNFLMPNLAYLTLIYDHFSVSFSTNLFSIKTIESSQLFERRRQPQLQNIPVLEKWIYLKLYIVIFTQNYKWWILQKLYSLFPLKVWVLPAGEISDTLDTKIGKSYRQRNYIIPMLGEYCWELQWHYRSYLKLW